MSTPLEHDTAPFEHDTTCATPRTPFAHRVYVAHLPHCVYMWHREYREHHAHDERPTQRQHHERASTILTWATCTPRPRWASHTPWVTYSRDQLTHGGPRRRAHARVIYPLRNFL